MVFSLMETIQKVLLVDDEPDFLTAPCKVLALISIRKVSERPPAKTSMSPFCTDYI